MTVIVRPLTGPEFDAAIPALANLRIRIFRAFPYLYDGDLAYEEKYLARFKAADRAFLAAAFDGDRIVGAATAAPMAGETDEFRAPFEKAGYDVSKVFYFAESLLLPEYRGHGVGHKFFDAREAHARSFGEYEFATFCSVVRPADHRRGRKATSRSTGSGPSAGSQGLRASPRPIRGRTLVIVRRPRRPCNSG